MPDTIQLVMPERAELIEIGKVVMDRLTTEGNPLFQHMPVKTTNEDKIIFEQEADTLGMQHARAVSGPSHRVQSLDAKRVTVDPFACGDHMFVTEEEIKSRRQLGTFGAQANITDITLKKQNQLIHREVSRILYTGWTMLGEGAVSNIAPDGQTVWTDQFPVNDYLITIPWSTYASATPIKDLRLMRNLQRGKGVKFDSTAVMYVNQDVANDLQNNRNPDDLWGIRQGGGNTVNGLKGINQVLAEENLPTLVIMDDGYKTTPTTEVQFLPYKRIVVCGKRQDAEAMAEYRMTFNPSTGSGGSHDFIIDSKDVGQPVPRWVKIERGHFGGPCLFFPSSFVRMRWV
jgi:hypothetical protein